jgi:YjbE family integral membrane protein
MTYVYEMLSNWNLFWIPLFGVIFTDIMLGGDNALVIGNAVQNVPEAKRKLALWIGISGAMILRAILLLVASYVLGIPGLYLIGGLLLLKIAYDMGGGDDSEHNISQHSSFAKAVITILVADLVMSMDNVIGVASTAHTAGQYSNILMVIGVFISIAFIAVASGIVSTIINKYPVTKVIGAMWLVWISGNLIAHENYNKVAEFIQGNVTIIPWIILGVSSLVFWLKIKQE